ncbi:MAG: hypothetical protein FJ109_08175 [Deltaproteobacteria bacterium]|nr:hypothetical protein [Deltaproteobacteria bacterium]
MSGSMLPLALMLIATLAAPACRQADRKPTGDVTGEAVPVRVPECPKVGGAIDLPDAGWTLKLVSFRFFRDIGTDANIVQAGPGHVFALAEVEWSQRSEAPPGTPPAAGLLQEPRDAGAPAVGAPATRRSERPPDLALWDRKGNRHAASQDALDAFMRMQPGARFGVQLGGPTERFLDAQGVRLRPQAARLGLRLAPEGPMPPLDSQPRFCLGPYDVR